MKATNGLELRVPPVLQLALAALLMLLADRLLPFLHLSLPGADFLTAILPLAGVAVALLGAGAFRRAGTTVDPRYPEKTARLVTGGIYRFTRNPMYLGMLLALAGWGAHLEHPLSLLFIVAFVLYLSRYQIEPEERFMDDKFGEEYRRYRTRVRRWL
jgi:protein-S-isoprenylcysteine O-methyltransferase Ste14